MPVLELLPPGLTGIVTAPARPQTQTAPPVRPVLLLADDLTEILQLLAFVFDRAGFEVHTAENGLDALLLAKDIRPDIALLNNQMPRMSGITACRELHATPRFDGMPKVVYSASSLPWFRPQALQAGARACWEVPMEASAFTKRTRAVLSGRERDPEALSDA